MAGAVVSASMGVMKPLLEKLATLMGDEYKKYKAVQNQACFLRDELSTMNAFLEKLELMDDELDPLAKNWRDQVREMSYDIEDYIDDFIVHHRGGVDEGLVDKITNYVKKLRESHRIANLIEELKVRVVEANDRRKRYKLDDSCKSSSSTSLTIVDPRISALYNETASLVGIDGPREELVKWLTDDTHQQLRVVSIVGFGGLGKTTLAKQVYDKIGEQYDCKAFVSVSQRPDMSGFLNCLGKELGAVLSSQACEVQYIIDKLREYLKNKRYIIVVDDIWDRSAWDTIRCAFPEYDKSSRVIVTTRVEDVACWACVNHQYVHKMKPLSEHDSRSLFMKRIFGSEDGCPSQYEEVSAEILKKCGGLPLAVITIASLLASRPSRTTEDWKSVRNSLGTKGSRNNMSLEGMRWILNLSYMNLPLHLRTCLLYLGMYPEDYNISRDDLVRQWVAEGFVIGNSCRQDLNDVAGSYFNELVNRSLIQPTDMVHGVVFHCRVHDMMLDLILRKCGESNFVSVPYNWEDVQGSSNKIRRLSLSFRSKGVVESNCTTIESRAIHASLAQARSVALFGMFSTDRLPLLLPLKHLRVLYLVVFSYCANRVDLSVINQMLQLRYLRVSMFHSANTELPIRISGLVHLETLAILGSQPISLPSDIVGLPRLSRLSFSRSMGPRMPNGVGNMKSLQKLGWFNLLDMDIKDVNDLGELTNLRDLRLSCKQEHSATGSSSLHLAALGTSIAKLPNLRCLMIAKGNDDGPCDADWLISLCDFASRGIEDVLLEGWRLSRVPRWINAGLHSLHQLTVDSVLDISTDDICLLGELPSLVRLFLSFHREHGGRAALVFGGISTGRSLFLALEILYINIYEEAVASRLVFQVGVMPKLRELKLAFLECDLDGSLLGTPAGMEHLLSLHSISARIHRKRDDTAPAEPLPQATTAEAERALRDAAQEHPNRPTVTFEWR